MQELKSDKNDKSEKGRGGWVRVMSSVCMNGGGHDGLDVWTRRQRVVDCLPPAREFEAMRWANVSRERERVSESGRESKRGGKMSCPSVA